MSKYEEINQAITDRLIRDIEQGAGEWKPSWSQAAGFPVNAATGNHYSGGNVIVLWVTGIDKGYPSGRWATYKQWAALGAQVRKGEHGTTLVKWITADKARRKSDADDVKRTAFPSAFTVFSAEQVDGYAIPAAPERNTVEAIEHAAAFFAATGAVVTVGEPAYHPARDVITLPDIDAFESAVAYYSTSAHEHTHWTGAKARLNRELSGRFGSEAYGAEELVAELGAAFVCAALNLTAEPRVESAAYLASWLRILKADPKALYTAASQASKALDYLSSFSNEQEVAA